MKANPQRRVCALLLRCGLAALFPLAAAIAATPAPDANAIQPAERLLFMANHWQRLRGAPELVYRLDKSGSLTAADSRRVQLKLARSPKGLGAVLSDGSAAAPLVLDAPLHGNPVILYFLERDISEMQRLTGGQPRYFQKRIRLALAQGPAISAVTEQWAGAPVPAQQIVIQPYLDDPGRARYERLAGKRYTFVLSARVPGQLLLLKTEVPGQRPEPTPGPEAQHSMQLQTATGPPGPPPVPTAAQDFGDPLQTVTLRLERAQP